MAPDLESGAGGRPVWLPGPNRVVPVAVGVVPLEVESEHFSLRDLDALGVSALVDLGADAKAGPGCGRRNQADDGGQTCQWRAAPVHADIGE